jgi:hypothetical protein
LPDYLYGEYTARRGELAIHADAILTRGVELAGVINPVAHDRNREDDMRLVSQLRERQLDVFPMEITLETGISETANLLSTSRLRVFNTLVSWSGEYPLYRRDKKGRPNEDVCPLLGCTALLALSARWKPPNSDSNSP